MLRIRLIGLSCILCCAACVDKIILDVPYPDEYPVVIDGYITTENTRHLIKVSRAFDVESHASYRTPMSVKQMILRDNDGLTEVLSESGTGNYYTNTFQGIAGHVYTLHVELMDGRVYESYPDTLYPSGTIEKIYSVFRSEQVNQQPAYSFDVYFDATTGGPHHNFLWKKHAYFFADIPCCTCLAQLVKPFPIVSQDQLVSNNRFDAVKIARIPLDGWAFQKGVWVEVSQQSVSRRAYDYWRIVGSQLTAGASLFQPATGKLPENFIQLQGSPQPLVGIFYATAKTMATGFVSRTDVPDQSLIPVVMSFPQGPNENTYGHTCPTVIPNSIRFN